jgi:serine phosphatase RsbU (regulator of sigma subunit)
MKIKFPTFKKRNIPDIEASSKQEEERIPEELTFRKLGKKEKSPLNDTVWKACLRIFAGTFLIWILSVVLGTSHPLSIWLIALAALGIWGLAVWMLLLDSSLRKFWIVWLGLSIVSLLFINQAEGVWFNTAVFSFVFLLFRRYKPYHHLTSRRRTALFLLGFLAFCLLIGGRTTAYQSEVVEPSSENILFLYSTPANLKTLGSSFAIYSISSLEIFWFFSLLHLFFSARLHFMKLKPKLAISAFLIAVVPLILVILMGLLILYGTLGATRAIQARSILNDWRSLAAIDENFIPSMFAQSFSYEKTGVPTPIQEDIPPWIQDFLSSLGSTESPYADRKELPTGDYFWINLGLWLIRISSRGDENLFIQGGRIDQPLMDRLAKNIRSDVSFIFSSAVRMTVAGIPLSLVEKKDGKPVEKLQGGYITEKVRSEEKIHPEDTQNSSRSLWKRPLYFGMTDVDVISFLDGKFENRKTLLLAEISIASIWDELTSQQNPFSLVVMIVLLSLAVLMLIFEAFMLFFGVRITTGVTSAVKALHRGTQRVIKGDFDIKIDIPNEDELGDLAASFNAMTVAVKKGREEAILRAQLESELETARKIQEKLLPREMPQLSGFEIAGTSLPSMQVGGDYFDFLDLGKGQLGVAIGDVSGKGIPAALLMANLQASLHAQTLEAGNVADVVSRINNLLVRSTESNMFATFFYGLLDRNTSTFTSTNAGHNPPILLRTTGDIERLETGDLVLGFLPDQKYSQQTISLKFGDILVLYTDGITEARSPESEKTEDKLFGEERLIEVLKTNDSLSAREIQAAILQAVSTHTKNTPQEDDITLVIIKRNNHEKAEAYSR